MFISLLSPLWQIGTSLKVTPASSLPIIPLETGKGKLAIINLQKTEYDAVSSARIFAKADETMLLLMQELGERMGSTICFNDMCPHFNCHSPIRYVLLFIHSYVCYVLMIARNAIGVEIPPFIEEEDGIQKLSTHVKPSKRS
jgi:hypothetical protein